MMDKATKSAIGVLASISMLLPSFPAESQTLYYPEPISKKQFEDWVIECFDPARTASMTTCQLYQRVAVGNGQRIAAVVTAAFPSYDTVRLQIALPLGIDIKSGMKLRVDDIEETFTINRCTQQGCLVEISATDAFIDLLLAAEAISVAPFLPGQGREFAIPISVKGLTKAIQELRINTEQNARESLAPPEAGTDETEIYQKMGNAISEPANEDGSIESLSLPGGADVSAESKKKASLVPDVDIKLPEVSPAGTDPRLAPVTGGDY
ncbi:MULTISPECIES: invasion associated locus B family protein [Sulfitobacter]|uniref:invasion associated locus B family protein n=1 Tax=Sulfitobacter TaxID=60136 RepID=UPI002307A53D|nr:invasion associated locus B family protein [Sulfitobacter faviae]WCE68599.1 invasion associated locus B family protein [Sulfitobacter faviae]